MIFDNILISFLILLSFDRIFSDDNEMDPKEAEEIIKEVATNVCKANISKSLISKLNLCEQIIAKTVIKFKLI